MTKLHAKNSLGTVLLLFALSMNAVSAFADVAVIVNPGSGVNSLTTAEARNLFLGKSKKFPNGKSARPVDHEEGSALRSVFNDKVLGKSRSQVKAYWSKKIFSGKGLPPDTLANDAAVKAHVAGNVDAVGYVDSSAVDGSVKAVLVVK